ncbi:TonB-dependent receptor [uncultured Flavobacterium sp.]|uniref:TonB-dependent receptor n=1 Tax=uncultured Flavobacterium sp. TaxID=165435 RepID=UPI0030CA3F6F|tara:strand:+ start:372 stop:2561 length:2190 start_codon:yes stop_codon:yes gene_type:complete
MKLFFLQSTKTHLSLFSVLFSLFSFAQEQLKDSTKITTLDEVMVSAIRVDSQTPITFSNLDKKDIASRNLGQDIPMLMNFMPSVVTTSDAGAGVGYTGIRVRGSDASRVNVTINGIPYNDSESQGTYWVNMPDFASSTASLQLQRGVGTSTNGAGAFGASLNLLTDATSEKSSTEISNSAGSFNTRKHTVKFSTGLMNESFELSGRLSQINSDGFVDRASSDLKGYFLQGSYSGKTTSIKALAFGGKEKTYQSWYGLEDLQKLKDDRTFNVAGMYFDADGTVKFYDNETDNYSQDHYQLHWSEKVNPYWTTNLALHYTYGRGYYEQYKEDEDFSTYNFDPIVLGGETIDKTDVIRRRWLDNNFFGTTFSANFKKNNINFIFGGAWNKYQGDHFGEVIWSQYASNSEIRDRYYDDYANKTDFNIFSKMNYKAASNLSLFADLQYRRVRYQANGVLSTFVDDTFNFFNPKAGLTFTLDKRNRFYASYAIANREPRRDDYENNSFKSEHLQDIEIGWRFASNKVQVNSNVYYMKYKDQLVLTGALNDVGSPVYTNSGDSFRLGIELEATIKLNNQFLIQPNLSLSQNKNKDFYFERDGVLLNLGSTNIAFSPNVVFGNSIAFKAKPNFQISVLSKYVGTQYMGNIDANSSKLDSYFINDFNVTYELKTKSIFKSIVFLVLVNNVLDVQYESNGYFYTYNDDYSNPGSISTVEGAGYYPQAGINFLAGMTLKF